VVTREKRDGVWIMARTPALSKADLQELIAFVGRQGLRHVEAGAPASRRLNQIRARRRPSMQRSNPRAQARGLFVKICSIPRERGGSADWRVSHSRVIDLNSQDVSAAHDATVGLG
jgi:hypothetical protein